MIDATRHAMRSAILLTGALAVSGRPAAAPARVTQVPRAAREAIARANAEWLEGMRREDTVAIVRAYADSAIFVTPSGVVEHPGGTAGPLRGRFLTVWATGSDGAWRIVRNLAFAF